MTQAIRTTCPYCGVGCGVLAQTAPDGTVTVKCDPEHPANFGRLCSNGAVLGETVDHEGRLLQPEINGSPTDAYVQVLLPAQAWGEKDGTVTNSERRISRQREFMSSPGEAKPDWWIVSEVAKRMGYAAHFDYPSAAQVFCEHVGLSAFENNGQCDSDIGALAGLDEA